MAQGQAQQPEPAASQGRNTPGEKPFEQQALLHPRGTTQTFRDTDVAEPKPHQTVKGLDKPRAAAPGVAQAMLAELQGYTEQRAHSTQARGRELLLHQPCETGAAGTAAAGTAAHLRCSPRAGSMGTSGPRDLLEQPSAIRYLHPAK